nr:uncharacterized protein LOC129488808 [Symphalangus syndactylus]
MGSPDQGLGRGLALAAGADWHAADLPAALQGGARRAIFRGLYKGAEAAARRPGSASARDGEGRGDTRASSRDAGAAGLGLVAGLRPSTRCLAQPGASGVRAPQREGVARRRGGPEAGGREVTVQSAGSGRLLEGARRRGPRGSRRGRRSGDTGHPASAWARGRDPREAVPGRSSRTQKQKRHPGPLPELPTGCQGAEKKRLRRKCHTMGENKGERSETAACARPPLAHSPRPAPRAPPPPRSRASF